MFDFTMSKHWTQQQQKNLPNMFWRWISMASNIQDSRRLFCNAWKSCVDSTHNNHWNFMYVNIQFDFGLQYVDMFCWTQSAFSRMFSIHMNLQRNSNMNNPSNTETRSKIRCCLRRAIASELCSRLLWSLFCNSSTSTRTRLNLEIICSFDH